MKNLTVKTRIILGFALVLSLVAAQAIATFVLLRKVNTEADSIASDSLPSALLAMKIRNNVCNMQISLLRVMIAKTPEDRKKFEDDIAARLAANNEASTAYAATIVQAEDRALSEELQLARDQY